MTDDRRLAVNTEPLRVEKIPTCRQCHKRAPWCSCGALDYDTQDQKEASDG